MLKDIWKGGTKIRRIGVRFACDICGTNYFVETNPFNPRDEHPNGWVHVDCDFRARGKIMSHCVSGELEADRKNKEETKSMHLDICPSCWCHEIPQWLDPGIMPKERYSEVE